MKERSDFIHVFVNQELPQFVVADRYQIPPLRLIK